MNYEGTQFLIDIFDNVDIFMLIFVRIIGLLTLLPVIGGSGIPIVARLGLALAISGIIYSSGNITQIVYPDNIIGYAMLILKEFLVGLILGYVVFLVFNTLYLTGHLTDQQIGYSMSSVFDPVSNTQVPITGNLYYFSLCALFILNKGHYMVINTIFHSYKALPIGKALILNNDNLMKLLMYAMAQFFVIGTLIALPIIGIILIMDISLGVLVKTVPKMNVFVVGMPLKVLAGLMGIWIIMPAFSDVYVKIFTLISDFMLNSIKVMMQ